MNKVTTKSGKEWTVRLASLRNVKALGQELGINVVKDGLTQLKLGDLIFDDAKLLKVIGMVVDGEVSEDDVSDLTVQDVEFLLIAFFFGTKLVSLQTNEGLAHLKDSINEKTFFGLPKDTTLTSPSLTPVTADQAK